MNEKNNTFILTDFIEYLTGKVLNLLGRVGKLISNKKSHDVIEMAIRIILMILLVVILRLPFELVGRLGVIIIYWIGTVFRYYFSVGWLIIINYSYYMLSLVLIYKIFKDILLNRELNIIEDDRKKDKKVKKSVFEPIINVVKVIVFIMTFPLFIILSILFSGLGMSFALLINGSYLVSLFIILIGLIIVFTSLLSLVFKFILEKIKSPRKHVEVLFTGFTIFIFGILALWFETINFSYSTSLPVDFKQNNIEVSINVEEGTDYYFIRGKNNEKIILDKNIDNSIENEIVIKGEYLETSVLSYDITNVNNQTNIVFYNDTNLNSDKIEKIFNSFLESIVDKTIYNFNKIKYSTIHIYANEDVIEKIKIVND